MDCLKVGGLILSLRKEKNLTQKQLADQIGVSDKAVSKWERGLGCPDVSLLSRLCGALNVDIEKMLAGELEGNDSVGGNMKKTKLYVCPECGNVLTSGAAAGITCCSRKLDELIPQKAEEQHRLQIEDTDGEWYVTTGHEMTKQHFISFMAFASGDKFLLCKQYPEWDFNVRMPKLGKGILYFYCTEHKLFYQTL